MIGETQLPLKPLIEDIKRLGKNPDVCTVGLVYRAVDCSSDDRRLNRPPWGYQPIKHETLWITLEVSCWIIKRLVNEPNTMKIPVNILHPLRRITQTMHLNC